MDQKIIDLYDAYTHLPLPRRVFLDRLSKLAGGTAAAAALLPVLENRALAAVGSQGSVRGALRKCGSKPAASPFPARPGR